MYDVIVACGGRGKRTNLDYNKIFYLLNDKPLITYTINVFLKDNDCNKIIIVYSKEDLFKLQTLFNNKKIIFTLGGKERFDSVENGLKEVESPYVLIHDGARPNLSLDLLDRIKKVLFEKGNAIPRINISDTLMHENEYVKRNEYYLVQTPQAFITDEIKKAYQLKEKNLYTDDSMIYVSSLKKDLSFVMGDKYNIKFTTLDDAFILEGVIK